MSEMKTCPFCGAGTIKQSDLKTCPFCLEEIPVRAIKCRFCESALDDVPPQASSSISPGGPAVVGGVQRDEPPRQAAYFQEAPEKQGKNRLLIPLAIIIVLLLLAGAGTGYWFLSRDQAVPAPQAVSEGEIIGSWRGASGENEVYFQFLPNEMVNVAIPLDGYWYRTQYRVISADANSYLELYHRNKAEWERTAELKITETEELIVIDTWDNIVISLERVPDPDFRDAISALRFER